MQNPPALRSRVATLVAVGMLAAPSARAAEGDEDAARTTVLVLDLEVSGMEASQAQLVNGVVAQTLAGFDNLEVVTTGDIRRVTDLEAQKQAMGCDQESCLAEIAGAMGAQYVIFGRIGRLDESTLVQLNLFDAVEARPIAREDVRGATLDEIVDRTAPATRRLTRTLLPEGTVIEDAPPPGGAGPSPLALGLLWGGAGVAAVAGTTALVTAGVATVNTLDVADKTKAPDARNDAKALGQIMVFTSVATGVVAVLGLGVAGASFLVE